MTKLRNTKIPITVCFKIKDLAQQIYDLNIDEILCLFKEVDDLFNKMHLVDRNEWNDHISKWIYQRDRRNQQDAFVNKAIRMRDESTNGHAAPSRRAKKSVYGTMRNDSSVSRSDSCVAAHEPWPGCSRVITCMRVHICVYACA